MLSNKSYIKWSASSTGNKWLKAFITYTNFRWHSSWRTDFLIMTMHSVIMASGWRNSPETKWQILRKSYHIEWKHFSFFFFYCNCDQKQINNGKKLLPTIHQVSANFLSAGPRISQQLNESLFGLSSASQSVRIMSDAQHMVGTGGTGVNASDLLSAIFTKQSPLQPTGQCTFPLDLVHDNKAAS